MFSEKAGCGSRKRWERENEYDKNTSFKILQNVINVIWKFKLADYFKSVSTHKELA